LPLSAATTLYEHLTGPVAANPHRLGKPLDEPFEEVLSARRGCGYGPGMPARKLPTPLHPRDHTFPGEVFLHLAADVLDWWQTSRQQPLALEGIQ
jgi:hypothetical protein